MINYLFLSLMLLIPSVLPMVLYSCKHRFMIRFYMAMAADEKVRKLYISVWLIILLVFHYVYIKVQPGDYGILLSTIPCLILVSYSRTDKLFRMVHERLKLVVILTLSAMAVMAIPHLYTLAATIVYFMTAALFYPSSRIIQECWKYGKKGCWKEQAEEIIRAYHCFHHAIRHECADSGKDMNPRDNQYQITENNEE